MSRPARLKAFDYLGYHRYFLTICTHQRRPLFSDSATIDLVTAQISHTAKEQGFEIPAYCFMQDHVHLLAIGADENADLTSFVRLMKQRAAWRFARARCGKLWQEGYFDRVLRNEESTLDVVRYILGNPVRAGLVNSPADYPYWGSLECTREQILDFIGEQGMPDLRGPAYI
jgi:putative transposase